MRIASLLLGASALLTACSGSGRGGGGNGGDTDGGGPSDDTATLAVEITMPESSGGARQFGFVQLRTGTVELDDAAWDDTAEDASGVELGTMRAKAMTSIESMDDSLDVTIQVRFCRAAKCTDPGDDTVPNVRYVLEHPFYLGEETSFRTAIGPGGLVEIPMGQTEMIARCDIGGCDLPRLSTYCNDEGVHYCDLPASMRPSRDAGIEEDDASADGGDGGEVDDSGSSFDSSVPDGGEI